MNNKNLNWEQVYELPLKLDEYGNYVWSKNDTMAIQFKNTSKKDMIKIIDLINGDSNLKIEGLTKEGCDFSINGELTFYVRGWGHLTGISALNLPQDKALEIQNGFIDYVFKQLNGIKQ